MYGYTQCWSTVQPYDTYVKVFFGYLRTGGLSPPQTLVAGEETPIFLKKYLKKFFARFARELEC